MTPTRPLLSLKAMSFSPKSTMRTGSPSGFNSSDAKAGNQYWRINSPIGVPAPTLVIASEFNVALFMAVILIQCKLIYSGT
jgi:hypothetical protein